MAGAVDFKLKCDADGFIIHIDPNNAPPLKGKCVGLSTEVTVSGVKVTEVVMEGDDFGTCRWRKVSGVWICA